VKKLDFSTNPINKVSKSYLNDVKKKDIISENKKASRNDSVIISNKAKELAQIESIRKIVSSAPEVRVEKVNELKEKIQNGTYYVSARDIVEKMLKGNYFNI
jgi:negative regulator of flagellin synthesis FlgM